jgi:hypothetical protein
MQLRARAAGRGARRGGGGERTENRRGSCSSRSRRRMRMAYLACAGSSLGCWYSSQSCWSRRAVRFISIRSFSST